VGFPSLSEAPNLVHEPWASAYGDELGRLRFQPVPFRLSRVADVDGELISSTGGVRRTWMPDDASHEVWLVGGGAAWGLGQRNDHTIASYLARESAADDMPTNVVNLAQPADTTWQAALRFEQALAERPAPDVVVLYGGADDMAVQIEGASSSPTHYNAEQLDAVLTGEDGGATEGFRSLGRLCRNQPPHTYRHFVSRHPRA